MTREVGTLAEIGAKPGDVVEFVEGCEGFDSYTKRYGGAHSMVNENGGVLGFISSCNHTFRMITRASADPFTWAEMTDAEKGALLLAHHEGKAIEYWRYDMWIKCDGFFSVHYAYRVKPVKTVLEAADDLARVAGDAAAILSAVGGHNAATTLKATLATYLELRGDAS